MKVVVAEVQAESNRYRAELKNEFDELKLAVETQLTALAEDNAASASELSAQVKIFQELLKIGQSPEKAVSSVASEDGFVEPDVDTALDILEQE